VGVGGAFGDEVAPDVARRSYWIAMRTSVSVVDATAFEMDDKEEPSGSISHYRFSRGATAV
jgi:hypothetical protein